MKFPFKKEVTGETHDMLEIGHRIRKRDFSGNMGLAVENSMYQIFSNLFGKISSLIFTIILARLLMPELFGLYSLALSTILIFSNFSNLGIGETLIRFVSRELGKKKNNKAFSYVYYFGKIKLILLFASVFLLLATAKFIAGTYYQKPLFLALIAGALYILFFEIITFLGFILQSSNYFKGLFQKEIIFQISRIILVPLAVLLALNYSFSEETILFYVFLSLAISYFLTILFLILFPLKKTFFAKKNFANRNHKKLTKKQKKNANKFLLATAVFVLSGVFFSLIDRIILGRFVSGEFIGYYSAAFSFVSALTSFIGFGAVLFPIFSRMKGGEREIGLQKSARLSFILGLTLFFITILFAPLAVKIAYGADYILSVNVLRFLSFLILILPLVGIYSVYIISLGKPQTVAKLLVFSTLLNIVLNYVFINSLIKYGAIASVYGAALATIISQGIYLGGLIFFKGKK